MADPEEGPGGPLLLDQTKARRAAPAPPPPPPPLSQGPDDRVLALTEGLDPPLFRVGKYSRRLQNLTIFETKTVHIANLFKTRDFFHTPRAVSYFIDREHARGALRKERRLLTGYFFLTSINFILRTELSI